MRFLWARLPRWIEPPAQFAYSIPATRRYSKVLQQRIVTKEHRIECDVGMPRKTRMGTMKTQQTGNNKAASYMGMIAQVSRSKLAVGDSSGDAIWGVSPVVVSAALEGGLSHERCEIILADLYSGIAGLDGRERLAEDYANGVGLPADFAADVFSCIKRVAEAYGERHAQDTGI